MHTIDAVGISRYKAVVDAFASDIRAGRLPAGTRLPTHRQLAAREGIALVTASRVYAELEAMGLVSGEQGRGTFVRDIALPPGHGIDQQAAARRHRRPQLQLPRPARSGRPAAPRPAGAGGIRRSRGAAALPAPSRPPAGPGRGRPPSAAARARGRRRPGPDRQRLAARAGQRRSWRRCGPGTWSPSTPSPTRASRSSPTRSGWNWRRCRRPRAEPISTPSSGCAPPGRSAPSTRCRPCTTRSAG